MRIKTTTLLKVEDFPDQKSWIGKLISPINDFFTQSLQIINDGVVFPDNFIGKDYLFKFTYQSAAISFPQKFQWNLRAKPQALIVVAASENGEAFIPAVAWQFATDGTIQLTSVVRLTTAPAVALLQAGKRYEIRVRVTP